MLDINWSQDTLVIHRATSLTRLERFEEATKVAEYLCDNNPENKKYHLFLLEIASVGKLKTDFAKALNDLEKHFVLTEENQNQIEVFKKSFENN
ncbi:hypothetical protein [Neobacillus niacini]|uniref:hypothetical protein n=1 Tax=Neobacillus niacini TaxID=86668 RepID=UPI003000C836